METETLQPVRSAAHYICIPTKRFTVPLPTTPYKMQHMTSVPGVTFTKKQSPNPSTQRRKSSDNAQTPTKASQSPVSILKSLTQPPTHLWADHTVAMAAGASWDQWMLARWISRVTAGRCSQIGPAVIEPCIQHSTLDHPPGWDQAGIAWLGATGHDLGCPNDVSIS